MSRIIQSESPRIAIRLSDSDSSTQKALTLLMNDANHNMLVHAGGQDLRVALARACDRIPCDIEKKVYIENLCSGESMRNARGQSNWQANPLNDNTQFEYFKVAHFRRSGGLHESEEWSTSVGIGGPHCRNRHSVTRPAETWRIIAPFCTSRVSVPFHTFVPNMLTQYRVPYEFVQN